MKYKNIIISSCLFAGFAWASHLPYARGLDLQIMRVVQSVASPLLNHIFVPFIIWGSSQISVSVFLLLSFWFYRKRDYQKAYLSLAALLIATGVEIACKRTFLIVSPGPEFRGSFPVSWDSISIKTQSCFPSGHALRTALLSSFVIGWLQPIKRQPLLLLILALIPAATGFGMIYYGFHWLSDVIAGFWIALLAFAIARRVLIS